MAALPFKAHANYGTWLIDFDIHIEFSKWYFVYYFDISKDELLKRNAYNWFVYLNSQQVLQSNTNLGKYLLFSNNN